MTRVKKKCICRQINRKYQSKFQTEKKNEQDKERNLRALLDDSK